MSQWEQSLQCLHLSLRPNCVWRWRWSVYVKPIPRRSRAKTMRWRRSDSPAARRWGGLWNISVLLKTNDEQQRGRCSSHKFSAGISIFTHRSGSVCNDWTSQSDSYWRATHTRLKIKKDSGRSLFYYWLLNYFFFCVCEKMISSHVASLLPLKKMHNGSRIH